MKENRIVAYRKKLDQVVERYHDFLGDETESLCRENSIPSAKDLQADLASIEDEDRLLKIGIVGRVNSGKSSLLNALLFEGERILPEAASPMTAALTTLSYEETLSAEVEFFTPKDIEDIKKKYDEYNHQLDLHYKEFLAQEKRKEARSSGESLKQSNKKSQSRTSEERARSKATREMRDKVELSAAHEQYTQMTNNGLSTRDQDLEKNPLLTFGSLSELRSQLDDYVGADGRYMPFTKSVNIRLPQENLKDIEIVDTPGINDPVQSREERARTHLKQCDVVLVISPSGQFMSNVDLELMDRITSKEGIRELFVVASQADTQLFGHLREEYDGQLDPVLENLTGDLGTHLEKIISDLKDSNPEVGDTYDPLLQGRSRIIHSSGICESLKKLFIQRDTWNEGMEHVWNNLRTGYPDYFSDTKEDLSSISLDKLSNMSVIRNIVEQVREKKQEIIKRKRTEYVQAKHHSLHSLRNGLIRYVNERQSQIESTDIAKLKNRKGELIKALDNASEDIKDEQEESVYRIKNSLKEELESEVKKGEGALENRIEQGRGETTKTIKKAGPIAWLKRLIGSEDGTQNIPIRTIRTSAVSYLLSEFSEELAELVREGTEEKKRSWRNDLNRNMTKILRRHFGDETLEASMIRRIIRNVVHSIVMPDFEYKNRIPDSLKLRGILTEKEAEDFLGEARDYYYGVSRNLKKKIRDYVEDLSEKMEQVRLDDLLLEQLTKELTVLENSIDNKEMELKRINRLKNDLNRIEMD